MSAEDDRRRSLLAAASQLLRDLRRGESETCMLCAAPMGQKHAAKCAAWPFILARQEYDTGVPTVQLPDEDKDTFE